MANNTKKPSFVKEVWNSRELIFRLAKNDFKTKYAGSYFGIIWAFVQPIVTILTWIKNDTAVYRISICIVSDSGHCSMVLFFRCMGKRNKLSDRV